MKKYRVVFVFVWECTQDTQYGKFMEQQQQLGFGTCCALCTRLICTVCVSYFLVSL